MHDEFPCEELFGSLDDPRRHLAFGQYDYTNARPHSLLENQTVADARRTLEQFDGSAHGALTHTDDKYYQAQTRRLWL